MRIYEKYLRNLAFARMIPKKPMMPNEVLGVGDFGYNRPVGIYIYKDAQQPAQTAVVRPVSQLKYEDLAIKGENDTLNIGYFNPERFTIGSPFGGI